MFENLPKDQQELINVAAAAMETAYNPYSLFYVGAALLSKDNQIIAGSNVENAAYGSCICAERAALVRANAMGHRQFKAIAIMARGEKEKTKEITAPCGSCRQMLYEAGQISGGDMEVLMSTTDKKKIIMSSIQELLPLAFGPKDLKIDIKKYQK